ncbi:2-hydroxy-3-oxopropionate reductase [Pirellulimonas nuda]|uniref:2-hydroxy-3-oxopropionate reductase n=1 Tax=Pirellulimonas nuda TaxID=2528009 RepID=A0A518DG55_9BACT|nr:NAD(P)-dependent oxidoreductase [Pirellulimonas nuda]QDU90439.1 2-hydroxy-3-oxopropionate reductase [Pirellulimonas nuda]
MPAQSRTPQPLGVVGLGLLGSALAERLLAGGFELLVFDREPDKAAPLVARGARWSENPIADCRRVVFCLYTTEVVEEVLGRCDQSLQPGQVLIDATTGSPEATARLGRRLSDRGVDYLESPILASSDQTRRGEGVALVAGREPAFDACRDVFHAMVARAHYLGAWGNAAKTKLVNNLILGLNRAALAEGLCFAESIGLDPAAALAVLRQGNAYSGVMDTKGQKMIDGDFSPQAKLSQHAKDVRMIVSLAKSNARPLPLTSLHLELLERAEQEGLGERDNSAIIQTFANMTQHSSHSEAT